MNLQQVFMQSDAIGKAVAILLLLMSIASWVVILWKAWMLRRAGGDVARSVAGRGTRYRPGRPPESRSTRPAG